MKDDKQKRRKERLRYRHELNRTHKEEREEKRIGKNETQKRRGEKDGK